MKHLAENRETHVALGLSAFLDMTQEHRPREERGQLRRYRIRPVAHQRRMERPPPGEGSIRQSRVCWASLSRPYRHVLLLDCSPAQKWAEFEQTFLQRRCLHLNGQLAHKKMLNIISH